MKVIFPNRQILAWISLVVVVILTAWSAHAAPNFSALEPGMHYGDVINILGAPSEKKEMETKREDLWYYKDFDAEVLFRSGKLVSWKRDEDASGLGAVGTAGDSKEIDGKGIENNADEGIVQDILSEIMREVPSEDETTKPTKKKRR